LAAKLGNEKVFKWALRTSRRRLDQSEWLIFQSKWLWIKET
jgi:hypothetical protein